MSYERQMRIIESNSRIINLLIINFINLFSDLKRQKVYTSVFFSLASHSYVSTFFFFLNKFFLKPSSSLIFCGKFEGQILLLSPRLFFYFSHTSESEAAYTLL